MKYEAHSNIDSTFVVFSKRSLVLAGDSTAEVKLWGTL